MSVFVNSLEILLIFWPGVMSFWRAFNDAGGGDFIKFSRNSFISFITNVEILIETRWSSDPSSFIVIPFCLKTGGISTEETASPYAALYA